MRCIGGAVKLKTKGTRSFNRARPLQDKINRRKHFIKGDTKRTTGSEERDDEKNVLT